MYHSGVLALVIWLDGSQLAAHARAFVVRSLLAWLGQHELAKAWAVLGRAFADHIFAHFGTACVR